MGGTNPVTFHDPVWPGAPVTPYRLLSFLWRDDFHTPNMYAVISQDEENGGDVLPRAVGVFNGDTQALINAALIDWDGSGTYPLCDLVGPIIRPPTSNKVYVGSSRDTGENGNTTFLTELDATTFAFSKKSQTPAASGAIFDTRGCLSIFGNVDGSFVGAKFAGTASSPLGSVCIWDTVHNKITYFANDADLGYTINNIPNNWCFADDGFLYVFVTNHPTGGNNQNVLDKYSIGVGPPPTLTKVASYNFGAPDAANSWVNIGVFFRPTAKELVFHNQLFGVPNVTYQVQKWNIISETLTTTYPFGINAVGDFVGSQSISGPLASRCVLGDTGAWTNVKVIGHVQWDVTESILTGFQLLDLDTGAITKYLLTLWPTDPAAAALVGGEINYVPSSNTIWTWRINEFILNHDGTYTYEGFAVYGFPTGEAAISSRVPMPTLHYAYDILNMGPRV
jgi:hypothetical protein